MNRFVLLILILPSFFKSQNFISDIRVTYLLESKDKKNSDEIHKKTFVLIANKENSIYKPAITYALDSIIITHPNDQKVFQKYYDPESQNKILIDNNNIKIYDKVNFSVLVYKENNEFNWKLENEKKEILGVKCYKATIKKYGREWIAYYAPQYQFPMGPYKFNKLPGLIMEIRDSKNEFVFTTRKIINYKKNINNNDEGVHLLSKEKFFKTIYTMHLDTSMGGKIKLNPEVARELIINEEQRLKNLNFIEDIPETKY